MKVSFVIPSHNNEAWLPQAVESVQNQTHKDIEIVIVNDGSTDHTKQYLDWLVKEDKRVRVINHDKPLGRSVARNRGNALASGSLLCVLDSDDLAVPNRAGWMVEMFNQGHKFVYGSAVTMDAVGRQVGELRAEPFKLRDALDRKTNGIVHSTVAYTKELAEKFPYPEGELSDLGLDDWAQQLAVASSGVELKDTPRVLSAYRILNTAISNTRDGKAVEKAKESYISKLEVPA